MICKNLHQQKGAYMNSNYSLDDTRTLAGIASVMLDRNIQTVSAVVDPFGRTLIIAYFADGRRVAISTDPKEGGGADANTGAGSADQS